MIERGLNILNLALFGLCCFVWGVIFERARTEHPQPTPAAYSSDMAIDHQTQDQIQT